MSFYMYLLVDTWCLEGHLQDRQPPVSVDPSWYPLVHVDAQSKVAVHCLTGLTYVTEGLT